MSATKSTESTNSEITELPPIQFHWKPLVVITVVLAVAFTAVAWYGNQNFTDMEIKSAGIAVLLCWLGSVLGLIPPMFLRGPEQGINGILAGMLFRMFFPLGGSYAVHQMDEQLRNANILFFTLGFFLLALIVDTILVVQMVKAQFSTQNTKTDI
ncbi:MAG: hypothetical protein CMJ82_14645 [Planctomycetaceae bacterium]|nr:hypothetical protein [Planctomycetaceae bacterium]